MGLNNSDNNYNYIEKLLLKYCSQIEMVPYKVCFEKMNKLRVTYSQREILVINNMIPGAYTVTW